MSCVGFDTCGEELDEDDMFKDDPISQIDIKVASYCTRLLVLDNVH